MQNVVQYQLNCSSQRKRSASSSLFSRCVTGSPRGNLASLSYLWARARSRRLLAVPLTSAAAAAAADATADAAADAQLYYKPTHNYTNKQSSKQMNKQTDKTNR